MTPFCPVFRALARVTRSRYSYEHMFALSPPRPSLSPELLARVRPVALAKSRTLPLGEPWRALVPDAGLRRGSTVVVEAPVGLGGLSLALSLLSEASAQAVSYTHLGVSPTGSGVRSAVRNRQMT